MTDTHRLDELADVVPELVQRGLDLVAGMFGQADEIEDAEIGWMSMIVSPRSFARLGDMLVVTYVGLVSAPFEATGVADNGGATVIPPSSTSRPMWVPGSSCRCTGT